MCMSASRDSFPIEKQKFEKKLTHKQYITLHFLLKGQSIMFHNSINNILEINKLRRIQISLYSLFTDH